MCAFLTPSNAWSMLEDTKSWDALCGTSDLSCLERHSTATLCRWKNGKEREDALEVRCTCSSPAA